MTSRLQLLILAASIFLGVLFPSLASLCKPVLYPTVFLLFFFAILQVAFSDAVAAVVKNNATLVILSWQLLGLPMLATIVLVPVLSGHWYLFALVTLSTSSITATTALAKILSLDDAMALSVCVLGTLFMPVPLYFVIHFAAGNDAQIDLGIYASRIVLYIILPFVLAWLIRKTAGVELMETIVRFTPSIVLILLMVFGLCVMDGVRDMMQNEPAHLLLLVVLAFSISLFVQLATYLILGFLGECNVKTACLCCAYRNMGIVAAMSGPALGENFLIFVGVWQLPMYTLPYVFERFYRPVNAGSACTS